MSSTTIKTPPGPFVARANLTARFARKSHWVMAGPALVWWLVFFIAPFISIVYYSLGQKAPFTSAQSVVFDHLSLANYHQSLSHVFFKVFVITLRTAEIGTVVCLLVGLPVAYALATRVASRWRPWLLLLLILPYWISFLLRTIAWRIVLAPEGILSGLLQHIGVIAGSLSILDTQTAVQLGIIYNYLPVAIFPIFVALDRIDPALMEASMDLGAGRIATFLRITLPLAAPGIIGAAVLTSVLAAGDYVVPAILGGAHGLMIGKIIAIEILGAQNLPLGAAMAVILIGLLGMVALAVIGAILVLRYLIKLVRGPAL